jgi:predicted CopG family antitoxin
MIFKSVIFVYYLCMAFKTLTIREEAHQRLKKHKLPGESFTQVILRELPDPLETAGDVLDFLKSQPRPELDPRARAALRKGRGRRSNRR